jgi:5-methylcytosine-specific restriction endonuclease McrA
LPAAVKREVWQRDGGRCCFVDSRGVRCPATAALEFHHHRPHALGGPATESNLTLRCRLCRMRHNRHYAAYGFMPHLA